MASTATFTLEELKRYYSTTTEKNISSRDMATLMDSIIARDASEDATVDSLDDRLTVAEVTASELMKENDRLNRLLAKLIFELAEQGIEIEHKELYQQIKTYLKY